MITLITPKPPVEVQFEKIEQKLKMVDYTIASAARELNGAMNLFWSAPDEVLLAMLNAQGPTKVLEIFTAHATTASMINAILADRNITPIAIIGEQKPIRINTDTGLFEMNYPIEPEPEPEPMEQLE